MTADPLQPLEENFHSKVDVAHARRLISVYSKVPAKDRPWYYEWALKIDDLAEAAEGAWAWMCSDWTGSENGEDFRAESIEALRRALDD